MRYMVIEHFGNNVKAVYQRYRDVGRLMPAGVTYVDSWVFGRCFQVVDCEDEALLEKWADNWRDLVTFEFFPVVSSAKAAQAALDESSHGQHSIS